MCLKAQNDAVMKKHGEYRYDGYLSGLAPLLKDSNYVIANLESPIMRSPYTQDNITQSDVCFATPSSLLDEVKAAGIDFVATCNNHCLDRGVDGLSETLRCIKAAGIDCSGSYLTVGDSEKVFVKQVGTLKVAVICCTFGTNSQLNGVFLNEDEQWRIDLTKKQQKLLKLEFKTSGEGKSIEKYISDDVSPAAITNSKNQVFLERVLEKVHKAKEVAECFSVDTSTVYRLNRQKKATGSVKLRTNQRGRKPSLSPTDLSNIDKAIQEQPDITIDEIIEKLNLHVANETVRKAVIKMGYIYKWFLSIFLLPISCKFLQNSVYLFS